MPQSCVERECPISREFDYEHHQVIVSHGKERYVGDLTRLEESVAGYDRWVEFLHRRDDAGFGSD